MAFIQEAISCNFISGNGPFTKRCQDYLPLHKSPYFKEKYLGNPLPNAENFANTLVRLPLHLYITDQNFEYIVNSCRLYFQKQSH